MKGALEDLLLVDPSFFDSFHFSSKYRVGVVDTEEAMEMKRKGFCFGGKRGEEGGKGETLACGK